jgi:hypothetical protein
MSTRFFACSACARHVKVGQCVCPFCGAKHQCAKPAGPAMQRLTRTAFGVAGAAGAAIALGCSSSSSPVGYPPYGAGPIYDASEEAPPTDATHPDAADGGATPDATEPDATDGGATPDAPSDGGDGG